MADLADLDYFNEHSLLRDPYAYFEAVRAKGPVHEMADSDILIVTGFDEVLDVFRNSEDFSAAPSVQHASAPLPFTPQGPDISAQIEAHRNEFYCSNLLVSYDDQKHAYSRSLLNRLFTPSRLKANEAYIASLTNRFVRDTVARGGCELIRDMATPFVTLVIADLLGVPAEDRPMIMKAFTLGETAGAVNSEERNVESHAMLLLAQYFADYIQARRANPSDDILSELANAKFPDGSTPDALEIVNLATFLFAAGQHTSAKLVGNAMRFMVDRPGLQDQLRKDRTLIPAFLDEVLRLEGSIKVASRLARKDTRIGDRAVPAGTRVLLSLAAANRDPNRWPDPQDFLLNRPKIKEHVAFGRGAHVCIGAPLARTEVRILFEHLLEQTANIDIVDEKHGSWGDRRLSYEPSYSIRGLTELHVAVTPAG
jgi:cytochrome P450